MPELPEVETIVRGLATRLEGAVLAETTLLWPPLLRRAPAGALSGLSGATVVGLRRRGKLAVIELDGGRALVFHLKMTGQLVLAPPSAPIDKHVRLTARFSNRAFELRFRDVRKFGFLCCLVPGGSVPELERLGPEPLETSRAAFAVLVGGRRGRVKSVLLDQSVLAGIGNIYADEILFKARVHPVSPASALSAASLDAMWRATRAVLRRAIARKGSSIRNYVDADGEPGDFQEDHAVYGREGKPCRTCETAIRRIRVAGRSTFFCPGCQRKPRRRRAKGVGRSL
jgi:formamidopyrimidine-DNA glycosylase